MAQLVAAMEEDFVAGGNDWSRAEVSALFELPFNDLLFRAQTVHRANFDPNQVQVSTLLSIKTGACAEDCAYCSQSAKYDTGLEREKLLPLDEVLDALPVEGFAGSGAIFDMTGKGAREAHALGQVQHYECEYRMRAKSGEYRWILSRGKIVERDDILAKLIDIQYERNDVEFSRGRFRVRGDCVEVWPWECLH